MERANKRPLMKQSKRKHSHDDFDVPDNDYEPDYDEESYYEKSLRSRGLGETDQGVAEGDNQATFVEENADLVRMLKHAGVPIKEGVLTDSTGSTLEHIKDTFRREVKDFMQTGELNPCGESVHVLRQQTTSLYEPRQKQQPINTANHGTSGTHRLLRDLHGIIGIERQGLRKGISAVVGDVHAIN